MMGKTSAATEAWEIEKPKDLFTACCPSNLRLILYAIVVPAVKIVALIMAELWREDQDPRKVRMAKHMVEAFSSR